MIHKKTDTVFLIVSLGICSLILFEVLTGFIYRNTAVRRANLKSVAREQKDRLEEMERDAISLYHVSDSYVDVFVICTNRHDVLLAGIYDDGTLPYRLAYTNTMGKVRVVDNGLHNSPSRMVLLSNSIGKRRFIGNVYSFQIPIPEDFVGIVDLHQCLRLVLLSGTTLESALKTTDLENSSVIFFRKSEPMELHENLCDTLIRHSPIITMPRRTLITP